MHDAPPLQSAAADGGSQGPSFALPWLAQISSGEADAEAGAAGGVGPGGAPHIPCLFYRLLLPALPPVPPAVLQKIQVCVCGGEASSPPNAGGKEARPATQHAPMTPALRAAVQAAADAIAGALAPPNPAGINSIVATPLEASLAQQAAAGSAVAVGRAARLRTASDAGAAASAAPVGVSVADLSTPLPFPSRPLPWLRWCMRAILLSRLRDDAWLIAGRPEPPSSTRRVRSEWACWQRLWACVARPPPSSSPLMLTPTTPPTRLQCPSTSTRGSEA